MFRYNRISAGTNDIDPDVHLGQTIDTPRKIELPVEKPTLTRCKATGQHNLCKKVCAFKLKSTATDFKPPWGYQAPRGPRRRRAPSDPELTRIVPEESQSFPLPHWTRIPARAVIGRLTNPIGAMC